MLSQRTAQAVWCCVVCILQHGVLACSLTSNRCTQHKGVLLVIKYGLFAQHVFGEFPEDVLIAIEKDARIIASHAQMFLHIDVEVLQHL